MENKVSNAALITSVRDIDSQWVADNASSDFVEVIMELARALEASEAQKCNALCSDIEQERDELLLALENAREDERRKVAEWIERNFAYDDSISASDVARAITDGSMP